MEAVGSSSLSSEGQTDNKKGLARKLTCSVLSVVFVGVILILLMQVFLTRKAVPEWGAETEDAMIELEEKNILRLASDKANFITEIFGRVGESVLQLHAFAAQALLEVPETMVVDHHVMTYPGVEQKITTWENSVWFINENGYSLEQIPSNSSLENLLNRSSLMDVPFRGLQRQHLLVYLAAINDPSAPADDLSASNFQAYAGFDMVDQGFPTFGVNEECDPRNVEYEAKENPTAYDPRCRPWYQDAVEGGNTGVIFTNPYEDIKTGVSTVTVAAPVFDVVDATLVRGVVGIDLDFTDIKQSINDLRVVDDEGYAYLLAPGGDGEVAVHKDLPGQEGEVTLITALETQVNPEEFNLIVATMNSECSGTATYSKKEVTWILAWSHETASESGATDGGGGCGSGGYITVVTVSKDALLEIFASTGSQIGQVVVFASLVMAAALLLIGCFVGTFTHGLSKSVTEPVNQLVDVLRTLNRMDFSKQSAGTWIVNDITSSEVEELMKAFEAMTTVIKFANVTMGSGDIDVARQNYIDAKVLFTKLGNDRGVSIVNNNLGNVYTLQARQLAARAAAEESAPAAAHLVEQANDKFDQAVISYQVAVDDATTLCAGYSQGAENMGGSSPLPGQGGGGGGEKKEANGLRRSPSFNPNADVEVGKTVASAGKDDEDDLSSSSALALQLANRKLNLALCLAAKGSIVVPAGVSPDLNAIHRARKLMRECADLAAYRNNAKGEQKRIECLLNLSELERGQPGRQQAAGEALDAAERVVRAYGGAGGIGGAGASGRGDGIAVPLAEGVAQPPLLTILRQQVLAARGTQCVADGHPEEAVKHWTDAVIGCGDRMDVGAVRTSLEGLRDQAKDGLGDQFPEAMLVALKLSPLSATNTFDREKLVAAVEVALKKVEVEATKYAGSLGASGPAVTSVDLCFVMDCTRSMQSWINQAKDKLFDIIAQAKRDDPNLQLRVSFVGYRDFGDKVRCEGPYDFHAEDEIPKLLSKLSQIKATGGKDVPEDIAGGLKHAVELSWRSPVRLCILIADAPCHGSQYHGFRDNYPGGCPKGLDPSELLYTLMYELGVDFYFVRITASTDKMIGVLKNTVNDYTQKHKHSRRPALRGTNNTKPGFVIHDLESSNNRFLEVVVDSVKVSAAGINLQVEVY